jgi:hypothetical protein
MNLRNRLLLIILFVVSSIPFAKAQDELLDILDNAENKQSKVFATFKTTRIVNAHSIETVKKKGLDFRVTHHFGDVFGEGGGAHTLFGIDQAADIRIAFEYGVTDKLTAGIGRSKVGEMIDGYLKYNVLHQTSDNKIPVSATLFANSALTPQKAGNEEYINPAHRFSYTFQVLLARKINQRLSLQLIPSFLHRNYVFNAKDENDLFSIGIGGRLKLTKRFAILADYFYTFSEFRRKNKDIYFAPLGLGIEIETGGHVFHMFFTNNAGIIENSYIPNTTSSWREGEFKFGFNISRTFGTGKKNRP